MIAPALTQLALNLTLREGASFDNFHAARNDAALRALRARCVAPVADFLPVMLWGEAGAGKTHLLEAACRAAHEAGQRVLYVPGAAHAGLAPEMLDDVEDGFIAVDDIGCFAGEPAWERALLHLYERLRGHGATLLITATTAPAGLPLLADFASRLGAGLVFHLHALGDEEKVEALRLRASRRGLEMPEEVARFVLSRYPRDTHALFALLDRLDAASLARQRRLTIPFLRSLDESAR